MEMLKIGVLCWNYGISKIKNHSHYSYGLLKENISPNEACIVDTENITLSMHYF